MSVRIELADGESIGDAVRRFRKLIQAEGAYPLYHGKWHKKDSRLYLKPGILNHRHRWIIRVRKKV